MKFVTKFLNDTFKDISDRSWISTLFWYTIDSKERTRKRLDNFLKQQIQNPHPDLVEVAKQFVKYKNTDRIVIEILKYVHNRVKYKRDIDNFGKVEYWADAHLTWITKFDDCDGINALIYILVRLASAQIINNYFWCVIGDTKAGGHYWNLYFSVKTGKWYSIDGTYYPNFTGIKYRPQFKFSQKKYINIWHIFNESYIFKQK